MTGAGFDAFTRRAAAAISRRASVLALGAAALGVPLGTEAAGKCKKKLKERAEEQVKDCRKGVKASCAEEPKTEQECRDACLPCCNPNDTFLGQANFACLVECFPPLVPA